MNRTRYILSFLILAGTVVATMGPRHLLTREVIPAASHAIVGRLSSCVATNEPGNDVLAVTISPIRSLWGRKLKNELHVEYKEFIPEIQEGMHIHFPNYTGSGIEWQAKPQQEYICFLKKKWMTFSLLRLEPVSNEKQILQQYEKQKKSPQQDPVGR